MKKCAVTLLAALLIASWGGTALADSIKGTLGLSGKFALIVPADSSVGDRIVDTDPGVGIAGGMIYGFDNNAAIEMELSHAWFDAKVPGQGSRDARLTDLAVGLQYRFTPENRMVPYLGAGFDVLVPDLEGKSVDTTIGAHVKGGIDYFVERNIVLVGEVKLTGGFETHMSDGGDFDPSSLMINGGVRFYFR